MMSDQSNKTILLVEDDPITQKTTSFILKKAGYNIVTASSGEEAVQLFSRPNQIQLILMDIDLGSGIDGTEAARHILTIVRLPIVFHTSHSEKSMVDKVRGITRYGYVVKNSGDFVLLSSIDMAFELFEANLQVEDKMEAVLRTEKRFSDLIKNLQVGILVQGPKAEILVSNDKAPELLGLSKDQLLGKSSFDPDWNVIHRDGSPFPGEFHPVPAAIQSKKPVIGVIMGVFRPVSADRVWLLVDAIPELDSNQNIIEVVCTFTDITGQINSEESVVHHEQKYNLLSEHLEDMIFKYDLLPFPKFTYVSHSSAKIIGYTPEEHYADPELGMKLIHPEDREKLLDTFKSKDFSKRFLFRWFTKSGNIIWTEQKLTPVYSESGELKGIEGVVKDITSQYYEKLKAEENYVKLNSLINSVNGIVWEYDFNRNQFTFVSHKATELLGYPIETWYEPDFWVNHIYQDDREEAVKFCTEESNARRNHEFTYRFIASDGRLVWVRDLVNVISENGKAVRLTGLITNITEQKELEFQLRENKERLKRAQKISKMGSWVWYPNGDIIWSEQMYELYQVPQQDKMTYPRFLTFFNTEESATVKTNFQKQLDSGAAVYSDEATFTLPDGSKKIFLRTGEIIRDKDGNVIRVDGVTQDLTDRKKVENELQHIQDLYEKVSRLSRIGGWEFDVINQKLIFSQVTKEIHDLPNDYVPDLESAINFYKAGESREKMISAYQEGLATGKPWDLELCIITAKGREIFVRAMGEAEFEKGKCVKLFGSFQDITEKVIFENKIQSLLSEKEILLKEVHHRIKNNMSTVVSLLSLHADSVTDQYAKQALEESGNRVRSMIVLYDRLFLTMNFRELSLSDYLIPLTTQIHKNFANTGKVLLHHDLCDVVLSSDKLFSIGIIVNELITNAMKYAFNDQTDGIIKVSADSEHDFITICVEDNGAGTGKPIDFENSDGFGLQLVYLLTKQLKATLTSSTENGTKVTFSFKSV